MTPHATTWTSPEFLPILSPVSDGDVPDLTPVSRYDKLPTHTDGSEPLEPIGLAEQPSVEPPAGTEAEASPADQAVLPLAADQPEVQVVLDRFTGSRKSVVETWLQRSARYLGMMRKVFRGHELPEDLVFIAMIESGFNPLAVSRAGAKGIWQFMAGTARRYGLRVDRWVDERFDPEKSTRAAAAYLKDLYAMFGSWELAKAAYNAGEMTVARAVQAARSTDFWVLTRTAYLRQETKEFVPQIVAATLIGRDPGRYGFEVPATERVPVDVVSVPPSTSLTRLARTSGVAGDELRSLNPTLVRALTPPEGIYDLRVPSGSRQAVLLALARPASGRMAGAQAPRMARAATHADPRATDVHVVRPRETVTSIARRYGVSVGDVLRWNRLGQKAWIRPGDRLRVSERRMSSDGSATSAAR